MPLRRVLANALAPAPSRLGYPLFGDRIKDRKQRWLVEGQPNPYAAVASKTGGTAFMRALGHSVPDLYGVYPSLHDIPRFEDLPKAFVLKPTGAAGGIGVFLMRDGFDLIRKRRFTRDDFIRELLSYKGIKATAVQGEWVAEELLFNYDAPTTAARDYKFYCFGPKVVAIVVNQMTGLKDPPYRVWLRDPDWQPLQYQLQWKRHPEPTALPAPPFLDDMLKMASDAAGRLNIFLRVDLFASHRGPVFCEFTAFPHDGNGFTPRADAWLGSLWQTRDGGVDR